MAAAGTFRNLIAWQEAMKLAEMVYRRTGEFPRAETYGLVAQMRRAAVSIPSNIAEGAGRSSSRELAQFIGVANGSLAELETQVELGLRLGYLTPDDGCASQVAQVGKLLTALRRSLRNRLAH